MKTIIARWGPALALMILIFIISSQPKANIPEFGLWDLFVKKGSHLLGYGLLGGAMLRGVRGPAPLTLRQMGWAFALTAMYALTDEYHQTFVTGRGGNLWDVGVDAAGATIGLTLQGWRLARLRPASLAAPYQSKSESNRR